jgi:hypothetical protein
MTKKAYPPTVCRGAPPVPPIPTSSSAHEPADLLSLGPGDAVMSDFDAPEDLPHPTTEDLEGLGSDDAIDIAENLLHLHSNPDDVDMTDPMGQADTEGMDNDNSPGANVNVAAKPTVQDIQEEEEQDYAGGIFDDGTGEDEDRKSAQSHNVNLPAPSTAQRPSFPHIDPTTELPHKAKPCTMTPFRAALNIFVSKYNVTREQWVDMRGMLHLLEDVPPEVAALPLRVDTIKENLDSQLPLIPMHTRELDLDVNLLQTRSGQSPKRLKEEIGLFDMKKFFQRLIQSDDIMRRVHLGMATIMDQPTEFWHSDSWGGSIRTTSGAFAKVLSGPAKDSIIFPSDFMWYYDARRGARFIGRVIFVGVDH